MSTKIIIDCDTGSDDAIALIAAAMHPDLDLVAVTTVNGNVALEYTTDNSLRALGVVGCDAPVFPGAARPLARPDFPIPRDMLNADNPEFQINTLDLPAATRGPETTSAAQFLVDTYLGPDAADTVLVAVGPLTNLALALSLDPRVAAGIPRLVIMGGADVGGNVSASAEFNIWVDPEAAHIVLTAGIRDVVIFPLDATHSAPLTLTDCAEYDSLGTPGAVATADLIRHRIVQDLGTDPDGHAASAPVHDPMCVAYLVDPAIATETITCPVDVETGGELSLGRLVLDRRPWTTDQANATVVLRASGERFRAFLRTALSEKES